MDKPTKPEEPKASPWPEESSSDQGFGATGVFQVVKAPDAAAGPAAGSGLESYFPESRAPEAPKPAPPPAPKPLAEPVVHKVVFGGGAESSPELLDRMRQASAERAPVAEKPPAAGSSGAGSGGFTELLRTLGSDSAAAPPPAREMPPPQRPAPPSGFTSLLQTLNAPEAAAPPVEVPTQAAPYAARSVPEEPRRAPAASGSGGFTELLRTTTGGDAGASALPMQPPGPAEAPFFAAGAGAIPAPAESKPGTFTQLFGAVGGEASAPAPPASDRAAGDSSRGSPGSFTRMLSLEPQPPAAEPAFQEERKPLPGSVNYGITPGMPGPAAPVRDPFAPPPVEAKPAESNPPGSGFGITRLIQMLDEPSKPPAVRVEAAPVSPPRGAEPGVWTQTFASLATPSEPAPPPAKAPAWAAPPTPAVAAPPAREAQFPGGPNEPVVHSAAPSGPSEFTRILDASRMREMAMRGGPGAANLPQAPLPQAPAPLPPPTMPSYPLPAAPPMGGMPGMGAMPQPGLYPPPLPQPPAYPMSYAPHAGAMPAAGGSLPQPPGMYAPAPPPMPAAPQAPPLKPADAGMSKLVPVLLVVLVVLAVAILLVLLFKH